MGAAYGLIISTLLLDLWLQSLPSWLLTVSSLPFSFLTSFCIHHCNHSHAKLTLAQITGCTRKGADPTEDSEVQESSSVSALKNCMPFIFFKPHRSSLVAQRNLAVAQVTAVVAGLILGLETSTCPMGTAKKIFLSSLKG